MGPATPWACPESHPIKGYVSQESGLRVYYLPGSRFYEEASPERCYASEEEAQRDGSRPARRPEPRDARKGSIMSDKVETVRSSSSGTVGRAQSVVRGQRVLLDSSARPQPDALTNSEAFLAGISSCGVTLIETHARETGVPLRRMDVTIEGVRTAAEPNRFASVTMTFELAGVTPAQADALVDVYRQR